MGNVSRKIFVYLAVAFSLSVAIQVLIAGIAIFVDPVKWKTHIIFVRIFEYIPLLMLIFSFLGNLPTSLRWHSLGLFLLIMGMYATANITSVIPIAGAFHPVIALIMFWISVSIIPKSWRFAYNGGNKRMNDTRSFI